MTDLLSECSRHRLKKLLARSWSTGSAFTLLQWYLEYLPSAFQNSEGYLEYLRFAFQNNEGCKGQSGEYEPAITRYENIKDKLQTEANRLHYKLEIDSCGMVKVVKL